MIEATSQKQHIESIIREYEVHAIDTWSQKYRDEFVLGPLWRGLSFSGMRVADLACGSGYNSEALLKCFPTAEPFGFDIAPSACEAYHARTGFPARECDLTAPMEATAEFDAAIVIGGLHHCVANLGQALRNIASLLKPGGIFMMMEPNRGYFLETARNFWYRHDRLFDAKNEHALAHDEILALASDAFALKDVKYFGGPAFFGVYNSLVLRIPMKMKPIISPPLMIAERGWNAMPGTRMHNAFLARWIRC
jgi:SAM-dependent methyltransferase